MKKFFYIGLLLALFTPVNSFSKNASGFVEGAYGFRDGDEKIKKHHYNLNEIRLQIKTTVYPSFLENYEGEFNLKGEALKDFYSDRETFKAYYREFNFFLTLGIFDIKLGRQIATWGTGDLLFINDMFPKDYISFFTGRDLEYLKRPSDAIRMWAFFGPLTVDALYIPLLTPNENLKGERFSIYSPFTEMIEGENLNYHYIEPTQTVENGEAALRIYGKTKGRELAFYLFRGFYKSPLGILDPATEKFYFPPVNVYGLSLRQGAFGGVFNVEAGYTESRDDKKGDNFFVENSMYKAMTGYELSFENDMKIGAQYYVEIMDDYKEYEKSLPPAMKAKDRKREVTTVKVEKNFLNQTLALSFFAFFSPDDNDNYLRTSLTYKASDTLSLAIGSNYFNGKQETQFGSLKGNDNIFARIRKSF